ncbi:MAG: helix-turn-helix transcriptional regulator [Clostridia bacterium]|nr:helix-turn-helix transcriptional regulator [Clostridia bacterium]
MLVHEKVHRYIQEQGIDIMELSSECDIPYQVFADMMNGRRKMYAEDLRNVCRALGVSPELFIEYRKGGFSDE